jgi:hypothetical protein
VATTLSTSARVGPERQPKGLHGSASRLA